MKKCCLILLSTIFILVSCSSNEYFFDKKTFEKDEVTYMDYEKYQKPLRLELEYWNGKETKNIFSMNEEDIHFIFEELKKSRHIDSQKKIDELVNGVPRYVWVIVRHLETKDGGQILLHADINENKVAEVFQGHYVQITDDLEKFLEEAENRPAISTE